MCSAVAAGCTSKDAVWQQECSAGSRGEVGPKQCSRGNCNLVKNPAVSDVKLIHPLTRGEELTLGGGDGVERERERKTQRKERGDLKPLSVISAPFHLMYIWKGPTFRDPIFASSRRIRKVLSTVKWKHGSKIWRAIKLLSHPPF